MIGDFLVFFSILLEHKSPTRTQKGLLEHDSPTRTQKTLMGGNVATMKNRKFAKKHLLLHAFIGTVEVH